MISLLADQRIKAVNALKRISTDRIDSREPLAGGKRQREHSELPSEHLPEKRNFE